MSGGRARVLLLGGGAREHALGACLAGSPQVGEVLALPGNPGLAEEPRVRLVQGDPTVPSAVATLARAQGVDLVVVGPEAPLVAGVADAVRAAGLPVFGPSRAAAAVEGSKHFAKELMRAAGIPTAGYEAFTDARAAAARARELGPVVVKADGLAAGKGVVVASSGEEAAAACLSLGQLPAGQTLLLEERLSGPEVSVIALCDGQRFALLPPAQDHKRLRDGDQGPNTGGMGAFTPAVLGVEQLDEVGRTVIAPALAELQRRGTPFQGALYAGLMLTPAGPRVLEFNARLGDPEAQALLLHLSDDLYPLLLACARGELPGGTRLAWRPGVTVAVVLASAGYPEAPRSGDVISGLERPLPEGVRVFHAGTRRQDGALVTAGGRVLSVCGRGATLEEARGRAYGFAQGITFAGKQLRADIGLSGS